jgi:hypothetical protein
VQEEALVDDPWKFPDDLTKANYCLALIATRNDSPAPLLPALHVSVIFTTSSVRVHCDSIMH